MEITSLELKDLVLHSAKGTAPTNYTVSAVNEALSDVLKSMSGSINTFMKNRYDIYDYIIEAADEVVPNRVASALSAFAEVKSVGQGQKAVFSRTVGRSRAKQFLTQVGISGVYETFRLDKESFELPTKAVGGAITADFERWLDGVEDTAVFMDVIVEGLTDAVFMEVQKALRAALNSTVRPEANKVISATFEPEKMVKLISIVKAYDGAAVIFAPPEFISAMGADAIVPVGANYAGVYSPKDIEAIHDTGYINIFRGTPIVEIPQSFVDESNEKTWIEPQLAYVLPAGKSKVVKVALEGKTQIYDLPNRDNSMEIHAYKKMGAGILTHYNWCIYQNEEIEQTFDSPYGL